MGKDSCYGWLKLDLWSGLDAQSLNLSIRVKVGIVKRRE